MTQCTRICALDSDIAQCRFWIIFIVLLHLHCLWCIRKATSDLLTVFCSMSRVWGGDRTYDFGVHVWQSVGNSIAIKSNVLVNSGHFKSSVSGILEENGGEGGAILDLTLRADMNQLLRSLSRQPPNHISIPPPLRYSVSQLGILTSTVTHCPVLWLTRIQNWDMI